MRNARIIKVTEKNADSGRVSLQKSDLLDFIEGKLRLLIIVNHGDTVENGEFYTDKRLNTLMSSALQNGPVFNKSSNEVFYLANK